MTHEPISQDGVGAPVRALSATDTLNTSPQPVGEVESGDGVKALVEQLNAWLAHFREDAPDPAIESDGDNTLSILFEKTANTLSTLGAEIERLRGEEFRLQAELFVSRTAAAQANTALQTAEATMGEVVEAANYLLGQYDAFGAGDGNHSDAYYGLVKGKHARWEALRSALSKLPALGGSK